MQSFEKMLDKLFLVLEEDPTENKLRIGQPIFKRESKNKIWVNAKNYLQTINRDPDHFIIFMNKETNGVANWKTSHKSDGIVLSSKTKDNNIISLMEKYILNYVTCSQCQSCNTIMTKDTSTRSYMIKCKVCKSIKYV